MLGPLATLLSVVPIAYLNLPPTQSLMFRAPGGLLALLVFLSVGLLIGILNAQRLAAKRRAEFVADELDLVLDEQRTLEAITLKLVAVADELQTSVDRYRNQFGGLAAVFRARRDGRIVECTDLFARFLGAASPERVLAQSLRDLFRDPAQWRELELALASGVLLSNRELRLRRNDGTPLTVVANIREAGGFVEGVAIDITDRKQTGEVERRGTRVADAAPGRSIDAALPALVVDLSSLGRERHALIAPRPDEEAVPR